MYLSTSEIRVRLVQSNTFKSSSNFLTDIFKAVLALWILFFFVFRDLLAIWYMMFSCVFVTNVCPMSGVTLDSIDCCP